jgi:biotin carboxyl carrier protein
MKYLLNINQQKFIVDQQGQQIQVLKQLEDTTESVISFELTTPSSSSQITRQGKNFFAKILGEHLEGQFEKETVKGSSAKFDGKILSPFTGKVLKLFVKTGDKIEKDAPLMVIEAMKMEYEVVSPIKGVVQEISINLSEQVGKDHLLALVST